MVVNVQLGGDSADVSGFNATRRFSKKVLLYVEYGSFFIHTSYCNVQYTIIQYNIIQYICIYVATRCRTTGVSPDESLTTHQSKTSCIINLCNITSSANQSPAVPTHTKHNTLSFARSESFRPAACFCTAQKEHSSLLSTADPLRYINIVTEKE